MQQVQIKRISSLSKILENEICVGTVSQNSWHTVIITIMDFYHYCCFIIPKSSSLLLLLVGIAVQAATNHRADR